MNSAQIINGLGAIADAEDEATLRALQSLLDAIEPASASADLYGALLGIFERFPEADGFGIFWTIVHLLEACEGYEPYLLDSVARKATKFNLIMINRLLNGGVVEVTDTSLLSVLVDVAENPAASEGAQEQARKFVLYQRNKEGAA